MSKNIKKTTIYDLATLAETSPSTVSSVINGTWENRRISKKLAKKILKIAEEQGYSVNAQASLLRRKRSNIIAMIVPKYDNRYFGDIAEQMEEMARARGLFPVITCTQRDPKLEYEATKELISFQAECLISTGATDPDRISKFCNASGVQSINLDLPGTEAPSVVSDNYSGARDLTRLILNRFEKELSWTGPLLFIGGRSSDHNTAARIQGFLEAHKERSIQVPEKNIMATGYSAENAAMALKGFKPKGPTGFFINSTISLEGVIHFYSELATGSDLIRYGCFDWDPFGSFLPGNVGMVKQDVTTMLNKVFELYEKRVTSKEQILIPCKLKSF